LARIFVEPTVNRGVDPREFAQTTGGDETVRSIRGTPAGSFCHPSIVPPSQPEPFIADLSPEQTLDAIYECAAAIRLELIYSPSIGGELRKRWANRLGDINLLTPAAAAEIQELRNELARYESDWHDALHLEIAQIRHGLWRLRELCQRHQQLANSE
jgi:hypothetical protein